MKIFATTIALLLGALTASAQYLCTEQGTVFTTTETVTVDGKTETVDLTTTVEEVTTAENGVVSARLLTVQKIPGNDFAEIKSYSSYTYDPATQLTVFIPMTAEDFKNDFINTMVEMARSQGQNVTDSDIAELDKAIRVKGELSLELPEAPDTTAKIPNKSLKMSIATQTMSFNIWEAKYLGFETVTVPAGTYENCFKMSYVQKINTPEGVEKNYCTSWFAKGIGEVKTIEADKKGNIRSTSELKSVRK